MNARVLRCHYKVDQVEAAVDVFKKNVFPLLKKQKGFKGVFFMTEAVTGDGVVVSLWENAEALLASEENRFFHEQVAKFVPFYREPPVREAYEVSLKMEAKQRRK
jgi:heme-degrading monooxygenase HmoA